MLCFYNLHSFSVNLKITPCNLYMDCVRVKLVESLPIVTSIDFAFLATFFLRIIHGIAST